MLNSSQRATHPLSLTAFAVLLRAASLRRRLVSGLGVGPPSAAVSSCACASSSKIRAASAASNSCSNRRRGGGRDEDSEREGE